MSPNVNFHHQLSSSLHLLDSTFDVLDDSVFLNADYFCAHATMLTALSLWNQVFWNTLFCFKATVSPTAALQGGNEFSVLSSKSDTCVGNFSVLSSKSDTCIDNCVENCANFSTISVSTECEHGCSFQGNMIAELKLSLLKEKHRQPH